MWARWKIAGQTKSQQTWVPVPAPLLSTCVTKDKSSSYPPLLPLGLSFLICVMGTGLLHPQSLPSLEALGLPSRNLPGDTGVVTLWGMLLGVF